MIFALDSGDLWGGQAQLRPPAACRGRAAEWASVVPRHQQIRKVMKLIAAKEIRRAHDALDDRAPRVGINNGEEIFS